MATYSTLSDKFLDTVENWLSPGEVFGIVYLSRAGGMIEHFWFNDFQKFYDLITKMRPQDAIDVFRGEHFSLKGSVDKDFIALALSYFPDKTPLMVARSCEVENSYLYVEECANHQELATHLDECSGECVSIGRYPNSRSVEPENMVSGLAPFIDGTLKWGVY
jgi:hypothetical protein